MNMEGTFGYIVTPRAMDRDGHISPKILLQELALVSTCRNRNEGAMKIYLRRQLGAVWMFRRVDLRQFSPIQLGDRLEGFASSRTLNDTEYILRSTFVRDGEVVAQMDAAIMAVLVKERKKLPCSAVEPLFNVAPLEEVPVFPRLPMRSDVDYCHEKTITEKDCDENAQHFASHNYADLVCRESGYWDGEYHMLKRLQLDYVKECLVGDTIHLGCVASGEGFTVQGIHENGKPCFNAYIEYER